MLRILIGALLLSVGQLAFAQKQIEVRNQTWLGYFNQTRFTKKSGAWVDLHYRLTGDFTKERLINIARSMLTLRNY